jgi:hypothetical protein
MVTILRGNSDMKMISSIRLKWVNEILKTGSNHACCDTRVVERKVGARIVQYTPNNNL